MFTEKRLMFLVCESPLHAGSGSELDFIDNPIQRERHTNFPKMESSSLKGAIRERFAALCNVDKKLGEEADKDAAAKKLEADKTLFNAAFGALQKEQTPGDERQGGLAFTDARLLLFPVKSMKGVFAWITCPFVLKRFEEDLKRVKNENPPLVDDVKIQPAKGKAICFSNDLVITTKVPDEEKGGDAKKEKYNVILEEYAFEKQEAKDIALNKWLADKIFPKNDLQFWNRLLQNNLVIVSDNDFADFTELSTEVITRNQIDAEKGTVKNGHLFTEEYLPADSVLYTVVMAHAEFAKNGQGKSDKDVMSFFTVNMNDQFKNAFQSGGNATIGKGLLRTVIL